MSLKKGDLVEVIGCFDLRFNKKFIGERFTLNEKIPVSLGAARGVGWRSPFQTEGKIFAPLEKYLRKVNPDGDELSDESFEELMTKLKSSTKNSNIVTVNINLEEVSNNGGIR